MLGPQNGLSVFALEKGEKFIFGFKKIKEVPRAQNQKWKTNLLVVADFRLTFSEALRQFKKQHFKIKLQNWGPIIIWHNLTCVQFFSLSKIPPP